MQKRHFTLSFIVLLVSGVSSMVALSAESLPASGGEMTFYGDVVNAPCSINIHSEHQVVVLGQVREDALQTIGEWTGATHFQIWLEDCDPTVRTTVSVMFKGTPDTKDPQVFQLDPDVESAGDVGIGIFDAKDNLVTPNSMPVEWTPIEEGRMPLQYTAKYRATGSNVVPGKADAAIDFSLLYQ